MYEKFQFRSTADQNVCLQEERAFLIHYLQLQSAEAATVEYLQQVARVRMDLDMAVSHIVEALRLTGGKFGDGKMGYGQTRDIQFFFIFISFFSF